MNNPHVDIVVNTYNGRYILENSLASLISQDYSSYHVFVTDNASSDGTEEWLRTTYPQIHFIKSERNLGMAAMNSVLSWPREHVQNCHAKYILTAGWDVVFDRRCVRRAVEVLESNKDVGIVGFNMIGALEWVEFAEFEKAALSLRATEIRDVDFVSGGSCMYRRDLLDVLGFLDPAYFAYAEEDDVQFRFREVGLRLVSINCPVWQNVKIAAFPTDYAAFLSMRNSIRFFVKNKGCLSGLRQALRIARIACGPCDDRNYSLRVNRRMRPFSPRRNFVIVLRAWAWNVINIGNTIVSRREMLVKLERARRLLSEDSR